MQFRTGCYQGLRMTQFRWLVLQFFGEESRRCVQFGVPCHGMHHSLYYTNCPIEVDCF